MTAVAAKQLQAAALFAWVYCATCRSLTLPSGIELLSPPLCQLEKLPSVLTGADVRGERIVGTVDGGPARLWDTGTGHLVALLPGDLSQQGAHGAWGSEVAAVAMAEA